MATSVIQIPGLRVKSIQRGITQITGGNTSATTTITAVDTTKSVLNDLGKNIAGASNISLYGSLITLTNGTTVTASSANNDPGQIRYHSWEIIEFY